jgi:hypothetical protein
VNTYLLGWAGQLLGRLDLRRFIDDMPYWTYRLGLHRIPLLTPLFAPRPAHRTSVSAAHGPAAERVRARGPHPKHYCHARLRGTACSAGTLVEGCSSLAQVEISDHKVHGDAAHGGETARSVVNTHT